MSTLVASSSAFPLPPVTAAVAVASGVTEQSLSRHSPSFGGTAPSAFGSAKSHLSNGSASSMVASGCRLLWRGRLALGPKQYLDGIAIVAHLFAVPSISPTASISHSSPFTEDPFTASSTSTSGVGTTSAADLCLGLEMMRGSDIKLVTSNLKAIPKALARSPVLCRTTSGQVEKGKGKQQVETVIVDTPTDVRIYIDPRCSETTAWFQDTFCRAGCEGNAVRLDAGGEEVIVFAPSLPDSSHNGSGSAPRPTITLSLGRAIKIGPGLPRPDDPMPRENLFTKKLRRTSSMPMLDFQAPAPAALKSINPLSRTVSLASIKEQPVFDRRFRKLSTIASLPSMLSAEATSTSRRILQRSASSKDPFGSTAAPPSKPQSFRRSTSSSAVAQPIRSTTSSSLAVPLKRSRSTMSSSSTSLSAKVMVESPPSSPTSEVSAVVRKRSSSLVPHSRSGGHVHDREGSPSPSCVSNTFEDEDEEMDDRLPELGARRRSTNSRSISIGQGAIGKIRRRGMTRCESAPVGVFKLGLPPGNSAGARRDRERSTSLAPSAAEGVEARNKATIRKLLLSSLTSRSVTREDERFAEVFSITLRGVQYALRDTFKMTLLDKSHASDLIRRHLDMYIPTQREPSIVVKHEEEEVQLISEQLLPAPTMPEAGMPTPPRSLEPMEVEGTV
ncbi:BQ2448_984 [Microbotryum intermedium]|uniref:BQ2448_984 protein n=1 Tax=Microbotryum intermedium TaxID=269621 RepID=A0A238FA29_9BASI|nr:BQ2448_984 [Microbotryum intermedium]